MTAAGLASRVTITMADIGNVQQITVILNTVLILRKAVRGGRYLSYAVRVIFRFIIIKRNHVLAVPASAVVRIAVIHVIKTVIGRVTANVLSAILTTDAVHIR